MKINIKAFLFWFFIVIILSPNLIFHITNDLVVFLRGGESILNGEKLYYDFIDIKPPLLYYIFAFIRLIFGYSEIGLRLFDFLYQLITAFLLYHLCKKVLNENLGKYAVVIYAFSYTVLNYSNTLQAETLIAPFVLILIYIYLYKNSLKYFFLAGFLFGIVFCFKYTFGVIILPFLIFDFFYLKLNLKDFFKKNLCILSAFLITLLLIFSILIDEQIRNGFIDVLTYLSFYGQNPPVSIGFFRTALKTSASFFGDMYSLLFVSFIVVGLYYYFFNSKEINDKLSHFIDINLYIVFFLFISILIERKFPIYHFPRLVIFLSILSAVGLNFLINDFKKNFVNILKKERKILLVLLIIVGILFSPLPRWLNIASYYYYFFTDKDKYNSIYSHAEKFGEHRPTLIKVANFLDSVSKKNDRVLVISTGGNLINFLLKDRILTKFGQSCFYLENPGIKYWDSLSLAEFTNADYIAVQNDDKYGFLGIDLRSSYEIITQKPKYRDILEKKFDIIKDFGAFKVYRKKRE